jgi:hypothetical protein
MKSAKERRSFRGAAELAEHAVKASSYLKEVCSACRSGDRPTAERALRQAIIELETARLELQVGME